MLSLLPALVFAVTTSAWAQTSLPVASLTAPTTPLFREGVTAPGNGAEALLGFQESSIKFNLENLMETLRDHQHEGWVLAAYPDPNTRRPLIGAGFSLDVPETPHPQYDALNPHLFVEPSAAQLWVAAGLPAERLTQILEQFDRDSARWTPKQYRRKIVRHTLTPQLTDEEATRLLRISAIQAVYNARAYCRGFDDLTGSQQMALSQLVFQMGTNLEGFVGFLGTLNDTNNARELSRLDGYPQTEAEHWRSIQSQLIDSQWARRYSTRASLVIAMFDPEYSRAPGSAQERVEAELHPPQEASPAPGSEVTLKRASYSKHSAHAKKATKSKRSKSKPTTEKRA
jgi:hypothetical protein